MYTPFLIAMKAPTPLADSATVCYRSLPLHSGMKRSDLEARNAQGVMLNLNNNSSLRLGLVRHDSADSDDSEGSSTNLNLKELEIRARGSLVVLLLLVRAQLDVALLGASP